MSAAGENQLDIYINAVLGKKAFGLVVLNVRNLTSFADRFIICSGRSTRQVSAIGEFVRQSLKSQGIRPLSVEGLKDGRWVLMDYGQTIIHVFHEPVREFYDLEGLWADAERVDTDRFQVDAGDTDMEWNDEE